MEIRNNTILYKYPQLYFDKVMTNSLNDEHLNNAFFIYTSHSGIIVCDYKVIDIINMCNGTNTFYDIVTSIDANNNETKKIIEYLLRKKIINIGAPLQCLPLTGDALESSNSNTYGFWIHITNNCNLRCKYCYIDKSESKIQIPRLNSILDSIITSARKHKVQKLIFKISGGEPLTNIATIEHLVDYVKNKCKNNKISLHFELLTNGTIISEQIITLIKNNNISISISLDSVNENDNESRVFANGMGSTELVKKNIDLYIANGIIPRIMVTVNNSNISQLPLLTEYLINKKLRFRFSLEKDYTKSIPQIVKNPHQLTKSLNDCFKIMEAALLEGNLNWQFKLNNIKFGIPRKRSCSAGSHFFAIGSDGSFASCGMGLGINKHLFSTNEDLIESLQRHYMYFSNQNKLCQTCNWMSCCGNDCPLQSQSNKLGDGTSPFCNVLKEIIPRLLKLDALRIFMHYNRKK